MTISREHSNTLEVVASLRAQNYAYRQQWANWLGLGSAGGAVALLSFAANLPDPDFALQRLIPGLAAFTVGLISAAPNLLFAASEASAGESHFAHAANREQLKEAIAKIPQVISAPPEIAERANAPRNKLIEEHDRFHWKAEAAWNAKMRWRWAIRLTMTISALAFIVGVAFPISMVLTGTKFVPTEPEHRSGSTTKTEVSPRPVTRPDKTALNDCNSASPQRGVPVAAD